MLCHFSVPSSGRDTFAVVKLVPQSPMATEAKQALRRDKKSPFSLDKKTSHFHVHSKQSLRRDPTG